MLDHTITARWRRDLIGAWPEQKRHWRTKVTYYEALLSLLRAGRTANTLSWRAVVDAVRPRGHRSTFYEVAGPNAKHPLLGALLAADSVEAMQLVLCYRRCGAIDQLIDETKVWSFWPYRESLVTRLNITPDADAVAAVDELVCAVVAWTRQTPELARELTFAPPLCVVEDLLLLRCGQLSAVNAAGLLSDAMREAAGADRSLAAADARATVPRRRAA
jgi:hypothetical protein